MNRSCFLSLAALPHTVQSLGHYVPRSVSGACGTGTMFSLVCALPSPTSAEGCPSLFGWFTGTTARSDSSRTCMSAVWLVAFADRPRSWDRDIPEVSRFSCMLFLSVRRLLDYAEPTGHSRFIAARRVAFPLDGIGSALRSATFRSSITWPTDALVYASPIASQRSPQDSGSGWIRSLLSCRALASPTTCRFIPALPSCR